MSKRSILRQFFQITFRISKSYVLLVIVQSLFLAILPIVNMIFPKLIIDELLGEKRIDYFIWVIVSIILINLVMNFLNATFQRLMMTRDIHINQKFIQELGKKVMYLDFEMIEDPSVLDLKERAMFSMTNQGAVQSIIVNVRIILQSVFTLIGVIGIMLTFEWWIILFLMGVVGVLSIANVVFKKYQVQFFKELIPVNRKYGHYLTRCFDFDIAKDVRLYRIDKIFLRSVTDYNYEIIRWFYKYNLRQGIYNGFNQALSALQQVLVYGYLAWKTILGQISIGGLTMYAQASMNFTRMVTSIFGSIAFIRQQCDYLQPFMEFMQIKTKSATEGGLPLDEIKTIEFDRVSFRYPRSLDYVLKNISFTIKPKETISIVGLNGSGKTTLVKLLCRLYDPVEGVIKINGIPVEKYHYPSYIQKIATVFQDYSIFAFSLQDNIVLNNEVDALRLQDAIQSISLTKTVSELTHGVNTHLSKSFEKEGTELSGGQQQKVAIARALYKKGDVVILDEPTSALDPIAEYEIYVHFNEMVEDKTSIYISHRMSSSIFCDRILVIEHGEIAAFDTHQRLMQDTNGLYYRLFSAQAKNYQTSNH